MNDSTPLHIHLGWFNAWRDMVRRAKANGNAEGYCRAAALAQSQYVMYSALYFAWVK